MRVPETAFKLIISLDQTSLKMSHVRMIKFNYKSIDKQSHLFEIHVVKLSLFVMKQFNRLLTYLMP